MLRKSQISARSTGHIEAGAAERAEILLRPGRISAVIRSLGTGVLQVPPSDRHAACPIGTFLPADPQLTNWSFTWPRFQGGFPIFPRVPPFSSICKREAGAKRLHAAGILAWVRRCREGWQDGRYWREQLTNAYALLPSTGWRGFR